MDPGDHITDLNVHVIQGSLSWCYFSPFFSCVGRVLVNVVFLTNAKNKPQPRFLLIWWPLPV
jgi:hypothetical protein